MIEGYRPESTASIIITTTTITITTTTITITTTTITIITHVKRDGNSK